MLLSAALAAVAFFRTMVDDEALYVAATPEAVIEIIEQRLKVPRWRPV